jgi:hypothetical protein
LRSGRKIRRKISDFLRYTEDYVPIRKIVGLEIFINKILIVIFSLLSRSNKSCPKPFNKSKWQMFGVAGSKFFLLYRLENCHLKNGQDLLFHGLKSSNSMSGKNKCERSSKCHQNSLKSR